MLAQAPSSGGSCDRRLVSGAGTNLQALIDAGLPISAVASNKAGAPALARGAQAGIRTGVFELEDYTSREERDLAMAEWLGAAGAELVVCAGYMQLLTPRFLERFPAINVHPSLLPAFPGVDAIGQALAAGVPETGVTVHFLDEGVDSGPVILQETVPVEPRDTPRRSTSAFGPSSTACCRRRSALSGGSPYAPDSMRRALISVFDKTGLDEFAARPLRAWHRARGQRRHRRVHLRAGTLRNAVDELTDVPEMLGGRVKTLHPRIHAAILARRDVEEDLDALAEYEIEPFDLVCVNLYPFAQVAARKDVREEEAVEMIDVGGPAMLRAAAKNFVHVAPCASSPLRAVLDELRLDGDLSAQTRRELAAEAFAHTAAYEASIAGWFADRETFPPRLIVSLERDRELPYGENPHQRAAYYPEVGARRHLLSRVEQLSGKELSFNNLADLDAARAVLREFELPACAIVKHTNPCGVGVAADLRTPTPRPTPPTRSRPTGAWWPSTGGSTRRSRSCSASSSWKS